MTRLGCVLILVLKLDGYMRLRIFFIWTWYRKSCVWLLWMEQKQHRCEPGASIECLMYIRSTSFLFRLGIFRDTFVNVRFKFCFVWNRAFAYFMDTIIDKKLKKPNMLFSFPNACNLIKYICLWISWSPLQINLL